MANGYFWVYPMVRPPNCHVSHVAPGLSTCYPSRSPGEDMRKNNDTAEFPDAHPMLSGNMYVYVYIYTYTYMYTYVYIYIYINLHMYTYIYTCIHMYICMYMYIYTHYAM